MSSAANSSRASALASAARASAQASSSQPRPSPLPRLRAGLLNPSHRGTRSHGPSTVEELDEYAGVNSEYHQLSSRERRRSRAARFGSSSSDRLAQLPKHLALRVESMLDTADKSALRHDYVQSREAFTRPPDSPVRQANLHLATVSPSRYAVLRSVLGRISSTLAEEGEGSQWAPDWIVEHGCAAGEGLWAASDLWKDESGPTVHYEGTDARISMLRAAEDIWRPVSATEEGEEDVGDDQDSATFSQVQATFKTGSGRIVGGDKVSAEQKRSGAGLILSSYALAHLPSDNARLTYLERLWNENPDADVFAFVEKGDERGFACIASAREHLLQLGREEMGLGGEDEDGRETLKLGGVTFYAQGEDGQASASATEDKVEAVQQAEAEVDPSLGCHVVMPCPHDRPCPLLHDFLQNGPPHPRMSSTATTSQHTSFKGPKLGLGTCSFPQRVSLPAYARKTAHIKRPESSSRYSFVVLRRGARPVVAEEHRDVVEEGAARTKIGILEEIRAAQKPDVVKRTEVPEAEVLSADDASSAAEPQTATATGEEESDDAGMEELMRLLPEALAHELESAGQAGGDDAMAEALAMAQAHLAGATPPSTTSSTAADWDVAPSSSEDIVETITPEDEEAMRLEAYSWPRVVAPPLKKGGHVTFDVCAASGAIERFTLARSSGRQVYHDARKAAWGDSFPHPPRAGKTVECRVPPASDVRAPPPQAGSTTTTRPKGDISSAAAIGADVVAPIPTRKANLATQQRESLAAGAQRQTTTAGAGKTTSEQIKKVGGARFDSGRRAHYAKAGSGGRKGSERAGQYAPREGKESRKKSMAAYEAEIQQAWREDDAQRGGRD